MRNLILLAASALIAPVTLPATLHAAAPESEHVVGQGETLNGIANRAGVSASAIAKANNLAAPFVVRAGQTLIIPRDGAKGDAAGAAATEMVHVVTLGETLGGIANRAGVSVSAIAKANNLAAPFAVKAGQKLAIPRDNAPQLAIARTPKPAARIIAARSPATAKAASSIPPAQETTHLVGPGETLGGIANRAGVPRGLIVEANGLQPPYTLREGQSLTIPRTRRHKVAEGETGFTISYKYGVPWDQIALANNMATDAPISAGQDLVIPTLLNPPVTGATPRTGTTAPAVQTGPAPTASASRFMWPVNGSVRRDYATGANYHNGLDISAPRGTMVRAAAAGKVKFAGYEKEQYGNLVVLDHGDGWFTVYGFLSRVTVKEGANVAAGERLGLVGDTGRAKGNELHFEIRQNGEPVDPSGQLPKAP